MFHKYFLLTYLLYYFSTDAKPVGQAPIFLGTPIYFLLHIIFKLNGHTSEFR